MLAGREDVSGDVTRLQVQLDTKSDVSRLEDYCLTITVNMSTDRLILDLHASGGPFHFHVHFSRAEQQ